MKEKECKQLWWFNPDYMLPVSGKAVLVLTSDKNVSIGSFDGEEWEIEGYKVEPECVEAWAQIHLPKMLREE